MRSRLLSSTLLKLMLIWLIPNGMLTSTANGHPPDRATKKFQPPRAVEMFMEFPCKKPQIRSYNLKDLMRDVLRNSAESASYPSYIIMKRCDGHAGCCNTTESSCSPKERSIYYDKMEIKVWSLETNSARRQWIRVEQHGECQCKVTTMEDRYQLNNQQPNVTLVR